MVGEAPRRMRFDEFEIDPDRRTLRQGGLPIPVFAKSFDLLTTLVEHSGEVLSKTELLDAVWPGQFVEEANLSVQISAIRKALGDDRRNPKYIVTVPGRGYAFIGHVERVETGFVVEHERITEIVTETEVELADTVRVASLTTEGRSGARIIAGSFFRKATASAIVAAIAFSLIGFAVYRFVRAEDGRFPFNSAKVTRVTTSGDVTMASISPDGRFAVYVRSNIKGNALWIQQIGNAAAIELVPALDAHFWGITISPDGKYVYYNLFISNKTELELHRVPILGGRSEFVAKNITGAVSFSPNGSEIAYIQPDSQKNSNSLFVASPDGKNKEVVATRPYPSSFIFEGRSTSWSPDGTTIACIVNNFDPTGNYASVVAVDRSDGTETKIGKDRWNEITSVEWLSDGLSIVIAANRNLNDPRQIWKLSVRDGAATRITNDLSEYSAFRASADGKSAVTVQTNVEHGIYVGSTRANEQDFVKIVSETSELVPIEWISGDRILFRSSRDGNPNLWTVLPDGSLPRQLTFGASVDSRGFCETSDKRHLIFTSLRSGRSSIWRADADGSNQFQLTDGDADAYPQCSDDGKTIIFQRGIFFKPEIWSVPIDGGYAQRLFDGRGKWPVLRNGGAEIAYFSMSGEDWYINSKNIDTGSMLNSIMLPNNFTGSRLRWSADGRQAYYNGNEGSIGNIWSVFSMGRKPEKLTNFTSLRLSDFSFSPDGMRSATVRSSSNSDLIHFESH